MRHPIRVYSVSIYDSYVSHNKDAIVFMDTVECSLKSVIMTAVVDSFEENTFRFFPQKGFKILCKLSASR